MVTSSFFPTAIAALHRFFSTCRRIALPCCCALCDTLSPEPVCAGCMQAYWPRASDRLSRCVRCAYPLVDMKTRLTGLTDQIAPLCGHCISAPPAFDATVTWAEYAAPLDTLILALKFKSQLALAFLFAQQLAAQVQHTVSESSIRPDFVMPVPLSKRRLTTRGYNQAWEIARPLARILGLCAHPALIVRTVDTPPQMQRSAKARRRNVRRAFTVPSAHQTMIRNRHIAVVDDVMTSGATLESVARVLKHAGAARVTNWVVLRTPQ